MDISKQVSDQDFHVQIDYDTFSSLLSSGNKKKVFEFIDKTFAAINNNSSTTPSFIINCSIEMIIYINKTLNSFEFAKIPTVPDYKKLFSILFNIPTISQLKDYVKKIAADSIDSFISEDSKMSPVIRQVLNYIKAHPDKDLSLKTLGPLFNIHPVYLGQLFQKETSIAFSEYVIKLKIDKAKQLLLETNMKVGEIAEKIGYSNTSYFFIQFKKCTGISPSDYRKSYTTGLGHS